MLENKKVEEKNKLICSLKFHFLVTSFKDIHFPRAQSEIPRLFPDLEEIFHPDLSWLMATMQDL